MFTDQEIESWLDGNFGGDRITIEKYLTTTEEGRTRLAGIKSFYAALKEQPLPELSFSLSDTVVKQIANREIVSKKKPAAFFTPIAILTTVAIGIASYLFLNKYSFFTAINGIMSGIVLLLALLFVGMGLLDWNEQRKRYRRLLIS